MSAIQKAPYIADEKPGKVAWCSCGHSRNGPYCDGTHKTVPGASRPVVVEIEEAKRVAWCGCRQSSNKPYCDGTHSRL